MTIERRNPVPRGRYWVAISDSPKYPHARSLFSNYLANHAQTISLIRKETLDGTLDWYLFEVSAPTPWEFTSGFALPTIARSPENPTAPIVNTSDDVTLRPSSPKPFGEQLQDMFADAKTLLFVAGLAWLYSQSGKR